MIPSRSLLRGRGSHDSGKVGMVELFFDLVFVFAVTQLSHSLLAHLTLDGAVQVVRLARLFDERIAQGALLED